MSEKDVSGVLDAFQSKDLVKQPFSLQAKLQQINQAFAPESVEEILQKLDAEGSDWAKKTAETLRKMSPTSLKITMKQLRLGKEKNLQECLQMEFRLTQRCCSGHDFIEGTFILKILIDNNSRFVQWQASEVCLLIETTVPSGSLLHCPKCPTPLSTRILPHCRANWNSSSTEVP